METNHLMSTGPSTENSDLEPSGINGDQGPLNVGGFINHSKFSLFQWSILILCLLTVAADGFDTVAVGFVGPAVAAQWGASKLSLGPLFSAALVGLAIGALFAGPMGDKIGRKRVLILSVFVFGFWSLISAFAASMTQLTILRFLTGLGLGAAMPNAVTLLSEYVPARRRSLLVNLMFCGFTLGASAGGFASSWLIPTQGWQSVFIVGGVLPIVLAFILMKLPESIRFMVMQNQPADHIRKILVRINSTIRITAKSFVLPREDSTKEKAPLAVLFSKKYWAGSALIWLTYFMGLVIYYLLTSWMPTLMREAGFTLRQAALMTASLSLGAGIGPLLCGWVMDKINATLVVAGAFFLTGIFVWITSGYTGSVTALFWLIFITGIFLTAALTSMPVLAATYYPTRGRASGVAWMLGIGRFGGIAGALAGGPMLSAGFGVGNILALLAIPSFISAAALLGKAYLEARSSKIEHPLAIDLEPTVQ